MVASVTLATFRRSLIIKVISPQAPTRADVAAVVDLMAEKLLEVLGAQAISFYIVEGNHIAATKLGFAPALWTGDAVKEKRFRDTAAGLLAIKIPRGHGIVGKVIETGEPVFVRVSDGPAPGATAVVQPEGFDVQSLLSVPLKTTVTLGAIEVVNRQMAEGMIGDFTSGDLDVVQEFAEYLSTLIHRMVDPKVRLAADDAARLISKLTGLPLVTATDELEVDDHLVKAIGEEVIQADGVFPIKRAGENSLVALMVNPLDYPKRERFSQSTGFSVEEVSVVCPAVFDALVGRYFRKTVDAIGMEDVNMASVTEAVNGAYEPAAGQGEGGPEELETNDSAPIIQLTNRVIEDAFVSGASDIHIDPTQTDVIVRYRVDGLCQDRLTLPKRAASAVVTRIKIMSNLDISETRLPQDGRIVFRRYTKKNIDVDLRVAVCPTNHGEKVVMRILDKKKTALPLGALGFSDENLTRYRDSIQQPYGMILHCGPTGSGKSMTLYSALGELNTRDMNIVTAEDPIEYTLPGLNQTQMNRTIGLTFARALRSYLRMDPDIILVGEIRDQETAQIAVEAALTGHLLVSTLHTNDAASTIARLVEMGVEPFNISASLVCVCAQRLVRRVCKCCRVQSEPNDRERDILEKAIGWNGAVFRSAPKGCPHCSGTGYSGRIGIHELMVNSEELTDAVNKGVESAELKRIAVRGGMTTLHQDSMLKVKLGITTLEEAFANVPADPCVAQPQFAAPLAQCA